nr:NAD(P)(+) transhydrogenase (Re/Si-specific) subunit beta [Actinomycetota bacterium]
MQVATFIAYLLAAALFIVGIRRLRSPETARSGNTLAAVGMTIALVATLFVIEFQALLLIGIAVVIGSVVGALTAQRVQMTAMPQMVAAYNGLGGGAAALIALSEFFHAEATGETSLVASVTVPLTILIGSVSFMGSVVAFLKLQELAFSGSVTFPLQQIVNGLLFVGILVLAANAISDGAILPFLSPVASVVAVLAASAVLGVLLVIPIGGADMPIVISLLNAFTGLAAAASGFVLENYILIIGGTIVGASGTILTRLMSSALGRPLGKIIFAGIAASGSSKKDDGEEKPVNDTNAGAIGEYLSDEAQKIIIIPGYGLAVAQAQGAMRDLMETLQSDGKEVL